MAAAHIIGAVASLAWPLLVAVLLWKLAPTLREVLRDRDVSLHGPGDMGSPSAASRCRRSRWSTSSADSWRICARTCRG